MMKPEMCQRFQNCNAAICPVDPRWRGAAHLAGEPICYYLRSTVKEGAAERFKDDPVADAVIAAAPAILEAHHDIRWRVERAAKSRHQGANLAQHSEGNAA
jgi:hypothetical protein